MAKYNFNFWQVFAHKQVNGFTHQQVIKRSENAEY